MPSQLKKFAMGDTQTPFLSTVTGADASIGSLNLEGINFGPSHSLYSFSVLSSLQGLLYVLNSLLFKDSKKQSCFPIHPPFEGYQ
ncbi:MAG: hypothetical protein GX754_12260 [Clostridiaceae bacterium]|nr:hypothetical protein [Clostridiaceae bacterium]